MTIINDDIGASFVVLDHPEALKPILRDLLPRNGTVKIAMAYHSEPEERQSDALGEEHPSNLGRKICECITNATNHNILEKSGVLNERRAVLLLGSVSFSKDRHR